MKQLPASRRAFLSLATASSACCLPALGAQGATALTEKDRIDIGGKGKEIIQKAYELGRDYHAKYGSCSQTSLAAIQDSVPFVPKDEMLVMAAGPLSGGATRTRNASCGAFTGCGLAIGSVCGRTRANFGGKAPLAGELLLQVHDKFVEAYGDVLCNNIRTKVDGKCPEVVGKAAAWAVEVLLKQFAGYQA
jgi:hypothetical protein